MVYTIYVACTEAGHNGLYHLCGLYRGGPYWSISSMWLVQRRTIMVYIIDVACREEDHKGLETGVCP